MADRPWNILSLCTGGLGLDLGVELAVPSARTVCGVEWEAFAAAYLGSLMEAGCVDAFPLWSDIRTFDGRPWCGVVDCVTAGYPCQPFSVAGKRRGADDPRHLWPHVARIIDECGPASVFLENVSGHLRLGFREVAGELHSMGYRVAAGLFTASEVGAPHRRERLFILGMADGGSNRRQHVCGVAGVAHGDWADNGIPIAHSACVADSCQQGPQGFAAANSAGANNGHAGRSGGTEVADTSLRLVPIAERGPQGRDGAGPAIPLFPPGPAEFDRWREVLSIDPTLEPAICSMAHGLAADRRHWLRLLGNGVCPLAAAHALRTLADELEGGG